MADENLHKELYLLMAESISIQSLNAKERSEVQNRLLSLEPNEMKKVINRLKKEKEEMNRVFAAKKKEAEQIKVLETAISDAKDAARSLDKEYLSAQSNIERKESTRSAAQLLDELDKLG